MKLVTINH